MFTETESGTSTALLFVIQFGLGMVLGPYLGSLVDRWDLRRTLIATNLMQAVALVPLWWVTPQRVWPAFVVAALQAVLTGVNNPANVAFLPSLVPASQLVAANAATGTAQSIARLVGAPVGGIVVEFGGLGAVIIADGLSFLSVAIAMSFVRAPARARAPDESGPADTSVAAGFTALRQRPILRHLVVVIGLAQLAQGMFLVLYVAFVVRRLGGEGAAIGIIRGTQAVGGIIGSIVIARAARRSRPTMLLTVGLLGMGTVSFMFWNAPFVVTSLVLSGVLFSLAGVPGAAMGVGILSTAQQATPSEFLGRVIGVADAVGLAGVAIGSLTAGLLIDRIGMTPLLEVQASLYIVAGAYAVFTLARRAIPTTSSIG